MPAIADDESRQNFILAFVLGLIAVVILLVIGIALYSHNSKVRTATASAPATVLAVVTETVAVVIPDGASVRVAGDTVNFYFATGSADLAPRAAEALAVVIKGVEGGRKAVVSGFHDTTGDPALNEQLAQRRAATVRDVLTGLGVPPAKIDLKKPAVTTGSGSDAQARRVEVKLVD
ncbi:outer membrane protein OmpA-like peptidoglycan-associated protein [Variovorax soli]|uniref:Outer membrane protein OmpA-like peptidoglycan-associated protein n=1 Tax=Variovorax soli TaxID=376815 RepID=A0ABU1NFD9_9BURK|nr:outer membrane protein OmpA-like peptidoglycan-associated protein [Variovorax soli]